MLKIQDRCLHTFPGSFLIAITFPSIICRSWSAVADFPLSWSATGPATPSNSASSSSSSSPSSSSSSCGHGSHSTTSVALSVVPSKMDTPDQLLLSEGVCRQLDVVRYHDHIKPQQTGLIKLQRSHGLGGANAVVTQESDGSIAHGLQGTSKTSLATISGVALDECAPTVRPDSALIIGLQEGPAGPHFPGPGSSPACETETVVTSTISETAAVQTAGSRPMTPPRPPFTLNQEPVRRQPFRTLMSRLRHPQLIPNQWSK